MRWDLSRVQASLQNLKYGIMYVNNKIIYTKNVIDTGEL